MKIVQVWIISLEATLMKGCRKPVRQSLLRWWNPGLFGSFIGRPELTPGREIVKDSYDLIEVDAAKQRMTQMKELIEKQKQYSKKIHSYTAVGYGTVPLYRYFVIAIENTIDTDEAMRRPTQLETSRS